MAKLLLSNVQFAVHGVSFFMLFFRNKESHLISQIKTGGEL